MATRAQRSAQFEGEVLPQLAALCNFAVALAGTADVEDLVQTTGVRALEHFDAYRAGTNIRAGDIAFHLCGVDELKLTVWNHQGLSDIVVSDLAGQGCEACAVCHVRMAQSPAIESLDAGKI